MDKTNADGTYHEHHRSHFSSQIEDSTSIIAITFRSVVDLPTDKVNDFLLTLRKSKQGIPRFPPVSLCS